MKRIVLLVLCCFFVFFTACGSDSGSDSQTSHSNYILDAKSQTIGFIYGLCHYTATSVSWEGYADTVFFHYSWQDDSLLLRKTKSTADVSADYSKGLYYIVLTGGTSGKLQGIWTEVGSCDAGENGEPLCKSDDEEDSSSKNTHDVTMSLVISSDDIHWSMEANSCAMNVIEYDFEGFLDDVNFSETDCMSGKAFMNGSSALISVTDFSVKDNIFYKKYTVSSMYKTCTYDEEASSDGAAEEYTQMSSSWCNTTNMTVYMSRYDSANDASYTSHYENTNSDEFEECVRSLFGE